MTRFRPIIQVLRVRIERLGKSVYDENFHGGVNIIRGNNSSGKSTILNFIYYGLGGDVFDWSETALLCERVLVEVLLNGRAATLAREISLKPGQAMDIFGGTIQEALEGPTTAWSRYPYRRSALKESFSQILFRLLDIPEASNEASGNVTIHQLMRLMYADQLSPVGTLFKFEQFDPPLLRDAVGRLVFGAYENELYANELQIRELEKEFTSVESELTAISKMLGQSGQILTAAWLENEIKRVQAEKLSIEEQIAQAEKALFASASADRLSLAAQNAAYAEVQRIQVEISTLNEAIDVCKFEIADAAVFVSDLESKLNALNDASATSDAFGRITFQYCPACYSPVEAEHPVHACHLCKNPFDGERARSRIISLISDTSRQLKQSRKLQKERAEESEGLQSKSTDAHSRWKIASGRLARLAQTPSSLAQQSLRSLQRSAGYVDRQIEDFEAKVQLSDALEKLIKRKAELNSEISTLSDRNEALKGALAKRLQVAYSEVEAEILKLLHGDLPREQAFINASSVQFDFVSNKLGVNNQSYFSASSRVILRNSFFIGLFAAATKDPSFRHLRMCILDSIEDKGMQIDRSHNFQREVVAASKAALCDHQIIFATSMIAAELDIPDLTVGHVSTLENPTLKFSPRR